MIPLSLLWGFLSKEAVDATELRALAAELMLYMYNAVGAYTTYLKRFSHCQCDLVFPR